MGGGRRGEEAKGVHVVEEIRGRRERRGVGVQRKGLYAVQVYSHDEKAWGVEMGGEAVLLISVGRAGDNGLSVLSRPNTILSEARTSAHSSQ